MIYIFEGLDGSGKSTQVEKLKQYYAGKENIVVKTIREPGGTIPGEYIRTILKSGVKLTPKQQLSLFCTSRRFLCDELKDIYDDKHTVLILDRFSLSTYAYQTASGLDIETIRKYIADICPTSHFIEHTSKTFFIDVPPEVCYERINTRNEEKDSFENLEYLKVVYGNYHKYISQMREIGSNIEIINGNQSPDEVFSEVLKKL